MNIVPNLNAFVALSIIGIASSANGEVAMTAEAFEDACTRPVEAWVSFCNGYAQALVDAVDLAGLACIPSGTTRTEVVVKIQNRTFGEIQSGDIPPDTPAFALGLTVLQEEFPCEKEGQ